MIDNGSTGSILSSQKYSELKNDLEPLVRPFNTSVYDASGNIIPSYGAVDVKISLGGCDFEQTMIICDIKQDGVIGQNFLLNYAENINYKHGRINTKINEIYCWLGDRSSVKCRALASLQKVDYQYFVHILFTTHSMIRYCRIYMFIFPRLYLLSM